MTSYLYNPAHELLTTQALGAAPTTFGYDLAGNTVREVGPSADVTYTWDGEHRLTQVSSAGSMETYTYDASGLRRRKQASGATTNFVWDRVNLLAELDGSLARAAQYTDFPGVWGGLSSQRRDGTSRHFVHDLSANTRALLDGAAVTDSYLYRAFGVEEAASGSTVNVLRFAGQVGYYRDLAERLYVRARHYRPGVGRWMSRDPVVNGVPDEAIQGTGANRYVYCASRPPVLLDPSGLRWGMGICWRWRWIYYRCGWRICRTPVPDPYPCPSPIPAPPSPPVPAPRPTPQPTPHPSPWPLPSPGPPPPIAGPGTSTDWLRLCRKLVIEGGGASECCGAMAAALASLELVEIQGASYQDCEQACMDVLANDTWPPGGLEELVRRTVSGCYGCDEEDRRNGALGVMASLLQGIRF